MYAVPAKRGIWRLIKLADGTEVKAELRGDEFCNFYRSQDGRMFIRNSATGLYESAGIGDIEAKAAKRRGTAQARRARRAQRMNVEPGVDHAPYDGKKTGLIILVEFADVKFKAAHDLALYKRIANEEGFTSEMGFMGSVRDYFRDQSLGRFDLQFDVVGPVAMPNGYVYYGAPTGGSYDNDKAVAQMVKDACKAVDSQVDFKDYDWDGDGEADQVFILYAGHGEASYDDENTIWPHEWDLYSATYPNYKPLVLDDTTIKTYACSCELGTTEKIDGIGTICHEFSHCLGLPDMYDTSGKGNYGMDLWDLMDYGSYNGDSFCPANYTSYERMYAGWQQPQELVDNCDVVGMKAIGDGGNTYIIYNDGNRDEYYLLENRQLKGWDAALPNSGLLILHVDYDAETWRYNKVNSTTTQRCTIFMADNTDLKSGVPDISWSDRAGDIYPYESNNSLTNTSLPRASVHHRNTDGTYLMNKPITDITKHDDGTVSFTFRNNNGSNGISNIQAAQTPVSTRIFSLDGRYLGHDLNALKKGIYIINGKKVVVTSNK